MEVLLRGHGGDEGAIAVLVRCNGGHGGAAGTPLRCHVDPTADWPNPRWHCGRFEHVQSFRRATTKVRGFDSFRRCYGDQ